jgi:hypothetical protein
MSGGKGNVPARKHFTHHQGSPFRFRERGRISKEASFKCKN